MFLETFHHEMITRHCGYPETSQNRPKFAKRKSRFQFLCPRLIPKVTACALFEKICIYFLIRFSKLNSKIIFRQSQANKHTCISEEMWSCRKISELRLKRKFWSLGSNLLNDLEHEKNGETWNWASDLVSINVSELRCGQDH